MNQICITAHHFRIFDYEPRENDFTIVVFLNSDGTCKSEPHESTKNFPDFMPMKEWRYNELTNGKQSISFRYLSRFLDIIEEDQIKIAKPFFEEYLKHLEK
jgi:hypothetical protein